MSITADQEQSTLTNAPNQLFVGGEWRDATGGATLEVEDPSTGESIASVADATPEDAASALDAACSVQAEWAATPPRDRGEILRRSFEAIGSIGALLQKLGRPNQAGSPAGAGSGEATAAAGSRVAMP